MKSWLRAVAAVTLFCFVTTQCVSAASGAGIEMSGLRETPSFLSIDVPSELGAVDSLYEAPSGANPQFVLHIQNAHANYEAQMKIKQLLSYMDQRYGFKTIFVEGASEKLDADYMRLFPDEARNLKLCDGLAKQGELTGAELYLMEADKKTQAFGIEEAALYRSNYNALKKVFGAETDIDHFFKGFDGKIDRVSSKVFTPETRELIADWKRFEQGRRAFMPFVKTLVQKSKKLLKVDLESLFAQVGWPQITRLLVIQRMEKDLDRTKALEEKKALLEVLRQKSASKELMAVLESFNEGNITVGKSTKEVSPREILERLASEMGPKGFKFSDYPSFSLFAGYVALKAELDPKILFAEIEYLFTQMLDALAKEPEQKLLLALYRDGELVRKLLHLELNRADWKQVVAAKERLTIPSLVSRLKAVVQTTDHRLQTTDKKSPQPSKGEGESLQSPVSGLQSVSDVMPSEFAKTMDELFATGLEFYDFAHQREAVFYKEMQGAMKERKISKAILITGGFHTDGMSDLFRDHDVSYGIVTPRLSEKSDENLYRKIMLQKNAGAFEISYLEAILKMEPLAAQFDQGGGDVTPIVQEFMAVANISDPDQAVAMLRETAETTGKTFLNGKDSKAFDIIKVGGGYRLVPREQGAAPVTTQVGSVKVETGSIASLMAPAIPAAQLEVGPSVRSEVRAGQVMRKYVLPAVSVVLFAGLGLLALSNPIVVNFLYAALQLPISASAFGVVMSVIGAVSGGVLGGVIALWKLTKHVNGEALKHVKALVAPYGLLNEREFSDHFTDQDLKNWVDLPDSELKQTFLDLAVIRALAEGILMDAKKEGNLIATPPKIQVEILRDWAWKLRTLHERFPNIERIIGKKFEELQKFFSVRGIDEQMGEEERNEWERFSLQFGYFLGTKYGKKPAPATDASEGKRSEMRAGKPEAVSRPVSPIVADLNQNVQSKMPWKKTLGMRSILRKYYGQEKGDQIYGLLDGFKAPWNAYWPLHTVENVYPEVWFPSATREYLSTNQSYLLLVLLIDKIMADPLNAVELKELLESLKSLQQAVIANSGSLHQYSTTSNAFDGSPSSVHYVSLDAIVNSAVLYARNSQEFLVMIQYFTEMAKDRSVWPAVRFAKRAFQSDSIDAKLFEKIAPFLVQIVRRSALVDRFHYTPDELSPQDMDWIFEILVRAVKENAAVEIKDATATDPSKWESVAQIFVDGLQVTPPRTRSEMRAGKPEAVSRPVSPIVADLNQNVQSKMPWKKTLGMRSILRKYYGQEKGDQIYGLLDGFKAPWNAYWPVSTGAYVHPSVWFPVASGQYLSTEQIYLLLFLLLDKIMTDPANVTELEEILESLKPLHKAIVANPETLLRAIDLSDPFEPGPSDYYNVSLDQIILSAVALANNPQEFRAMIRFFTEVAGNEKGRNVWAAVKFLKRATEASSADSVTLEKIYPFLRQMIRLSRETLMYVGLDDADMDWITTTLRTAVENGSAVEVQPPTDSNPYSWDSVARIFVDNVQAVRPSARSEVREIGSLMQYLAKPSWAGEYTMPFQAIDVETVPQLSDGEFNAFVDRLRNEPALRAAFNAKVRESAKLSPKKPLIESVDQPGTFKLSNQGTFSLSLLKATPQDGAQVLIKFSNDDAIRSILRVLEGLYVFMSMESGTGYSGQTQGAGRSEVRKPGRGREDVLRVVRKGGKVEIVREPWWFGTARKWRPWILGSLLVALVGVPMAVHEIRGYFANQAREYYDVTLPQNEVLAEMLEISNSDSALFDKMRSLFVEAFPELKANGIIAEDSYDSYDVVDFAEYVKNFNAEDPDNKKLSPDLFLRIRDLSAQIYQLSLLKSTTPEARRSEVRSVSLILGLVSALAASGFMIAHAGLAEVSSLRAQLGLGPQVAPMEEGVLFDSQDPRIQDKLAVLASAIAAARGKEVVVQWSENGIVKSATGAFMGRIQGGLITLMDPRADVYQIEASSVLNVGLASPASRSEVRLVGDPLGIAADYYSLAYSTVSGPEKLKRIMSLKDKILADLTADMTDATERINSANRALVPIREFSTVLEGAPSVEEKDLLQSFPERAKGALDLVFGDELTERRMEIERKVNEIVTHGGPLGRERLKALVKLLSENLSKKLQQAARRLPAASAGIKELSGLKPPQGSDLAAEAKFSVSFLAKAAKAMNLIFQYNDTDLKTELVRKLSEIAKSGGENSRRAQEYLSAIPEGDKPLEGNVALPALEFYVEYEKARQDSSRSEMRAAIAEVLRGLPENPEVNPQGLIGLVQTTEPINLRDVSNAIRWGYSDETDPGRIEQIRGVLSQLRDIGAGSVMTSARSEARLDKTGEAEGSSAKKAAAEVREGDERRAGGSERRTSISADQSWEIRRLISGAQTRLKGTSYEGLIDAPMASALLAVSEKDWGATVQFIKKAIAVLTSPDLEVPLSARLSGPVTDLYGALSIIDPAQGSVRSETRVAPKELEATEAVLARQALSVEVAKILKPEVLTRLQSSGFEIGNGSLADLVGLIVLPADLKNITAAQVAEMLTKLVTPKSGEMDWQKFLAAAKKFLSDPITAVSDAPGGTVIALNEAPTAEELDAQVLQLGMNTGQVVRYVIAKAAVNADGQKALTKRIEAIQKGFDLKGEPIGDRIKLVFADKIVVGAQNSALALASQEAFEGGKNLTVLIPEGMKLEQAVGTVIESRGVVAALAPARNLVAMRAAQLGVALDNMDAMALLNQQIADVLQMIQQHFWIDGTKLAALNKMLSEMMATTIATAIAA